MIIRILVLVSLICISFPGYAIEVKTAPASSIFTSEPVPGASCQCVGSNNCTDIPTRKYKCTISSSNQNEGFMLNLSSVDPLAKTVAPKISDPNRSIANFLNVIIYGGIILYILPTLIVLFSKNRAHRISTILINIFLGWSGLGWFVALFLSLQSSIIKVEFIDKNIVNSDKIG